MEMDENIYEYDDYPKLVTGSIGESEEFKTISYPYDKYDILVKLSPSNEFLEILEVKVNKDFLSHKQRMGMQSYLDTDEYYRE